MPHLLRETLLWASDSLSVIDVGVNANLIRGKRANDRVPPEVLPTLQPPGRRAAVAKAAGDRLLHDLLDGLVRQSGIETRDFPSYYEKKNGSRKSELVK